MIEEGPRSDSVQAGMSDRGEGASRKLSPPGMGPEGDRPLLDNAIPDPDVEESEFIHTATSPLSRSSRDDLATVPFPLFAGEGGDDSRG